MSKLSSAGLTLPELIVVIFILMTLLGFIGTSLVSSQRNVSMQTTVSSLMTDWKSQQNNAMTGFTDGSADPDSYGIYFSDGTYTLFHGTVYNPADTSNFTIELDPQFQFDTSGKSVIFTRRTGNILNYSGLANTIQLQDTATNKSTTLQFNMFGTIVDE